MCIRDSPKVPKGFGYGNGRMEATTVEILPKFSARIDELSVKEGDTVKKGQVLVRLDKRDLEAQVKQAEAEVKKSKSDLLLAKQNLKRSKDLYVTKDIPLKDLQQDEANVATADASVAAAQAKVESLKVNLSECELASPIDGRILYKSREQGEMVNADSSILTVIDLTDVYMQFYLRTEQAGQVAVGADARIVLDARPDRPIPAKVTFIEPRSQFTPKQVETQEERDKLMFRIKVNIAPELLKRHFDQVKTGLPGMAYVQLDKTVAWPPHLAGSADDQPRTTP